MSAINSKYYSNFSMSERDLVMERVNKIFEALATLLTTLHIVSVLLSTYCCLIALLVKLVGPVTDIPETCLLFSESSKAESEASQIQQNPFIQW